jgi:CheY-like chemotaxis protein
MHTILVVDDEPAIRAFVRAALEPHGVRVIESTDGVGALTTAEEVRPDLILLDIALPRMSGLDVCRRLKADARTAAIPVLLLTGLVQQADAGVAADVGAQGLLAKPFSPAQLASRVAAALRCPAPARS